MDRRGTCLDGMRWTVKVKEMIPKQWNGNAGSMIRAKGSLLLPEEVRTGV